MFLHLSLQQVALQQDSERWLRRCMVCFNQMGVCPTQYWKIKVWSSQEMCKSNDCGEICRPLWSRRVLTERAKNALWLTSSDSAKSSWSTFTVLCKKINKLLSWKNKYSISEGGRNRDRHAKPALLHYRHVKNGHRQQKWSMFCHWHSFWKCWFMTCFTHVFPLAGSSSTW